MSVKFKIIHSSHKNEDNIKEYISSLPKGSIFYDLGANLGWFSLYAASLGLKTYAFEVSSENFEGLKENLENNPNLNNIFIFNKGIADKKQIINLRTRDQVTGSHHKTLDLPNYSGQKNIINTSYVTPIEVDSLDNIILENNLPFPDHLKVDIDGSEYAFLLGSPNVLSHIKSLVIELTIDNSYYELCTSILEENGLKKTTIYDIPSEPNLKNIVFTKNVE
jgi:FkbM family methyltransferase